MTGEEQRAALYRAQLKTGAAAYRARLALLAGDPAAAAAVRAAWDPARLGLLEARESAHPLPPLYDPTRPAWVSSLPPEIELPEHLKHPPRG